MIRPSCHEQHNRLPGCCPPAKQRDTSGWPAACPRTCKVKRGKTGVNEPVWRHEACGGAKVRRRNGTEVQEAWVRKGTGVKMY